MGLSNSKGIFAQSFRIPSPSLTEKNLPDQIGKVIIVTGGYAGVGQELSRILYQKNATVYIAGRSSEKASKSIAATKSLFPASNGRLEFLHLDLADLATIKKSAEEFEKKETRLDVLVNNAGVMVPPAGSKTAQGHELQMGTNVLGHFLFTELLVPILTRTAAISPPNSVRVTWAGSLAIVVYSPPDGIKFDGEGSPEVFASQQSNYGQSKVGNLYLAVEFARRHEKDGIVSVCFNPGNLRTELARHTGTLTVVVANWLLLHPAVFGAYTELYSGWSEDITLENTGAYVIPWGRDGNWSLRGDVMKAVEEEGGEGVVGKTWDWCQKESRAFR